MTLGMRFDYWLALGFFAQVLFSARFIVQWIASEREGRSVVPLLFWYLSLSGSSLLLIYAIHRQDPVFIVGQGAGVAIYLRNLHLIYRERRLCSQAPEADAASGSAGKEP